MKTNTKEIKEKLTKKIKEAYILSLKAGTTRCEASRSAGVDVSTIWKWAKNDKEFAKDIEVALESRIKTVEDALYRLAAGHKRIKDGKELKDSDGNVQMTQGNVVAQIFYLKNRGKEEWKDKQEIDVKVPDTIRIKHFIQAGKEPVIKDEEELPMKEKEVLEEPRDEPKEEIQGEIETVL